MPRYVGLVAKTAAKEPLMVAERLIGVLQEAGYEPILVEPLRYPSKTSVPLISDLSRERLELLVTVGGDGTILKAAREVSAQVPLLGINVGGRGVLAETLPDAAREAIEKLKEGDFTVERRLRLRVTAGGVTLPPALNEVYIERASLTYTPTFTVSFPEEGTFHQRMDAIVISTPTGSTGHSFSHGSPFLHGRLEAFLITPVGAVSNLPPIVIPPSPVEVSSNDDVSVVIDGQEVFKVQPNLPIRVGRHENDALFVRFNRSPLRQLSNLGFR